MLGIGALALVSYIPALKMAFSPRSGRELLPLLQASARTQLALGGLLAATFFVTR